MKNNRSPHSKLTWLTKKVISLFHHLWPDSAINPNYNPSLIPVAFQEPNSYLCTPVFEEAPAQLCTCRLSLGAPSPSILGSRLETLGFVLPESGGLRRTICSWRWDNPSDLHSDGLDSLHITLSLSRMAILDQQVGAIGSCSICTPTWRSGSLWLWPICI